MTKIPAIIIARGGSRRMPRKNVMPFCGRSLVEWSVIQLYNSHLISGVWMSTDDEEIATIATKAGAQIIWEAPLEGHRHGGHSMCAAMEHILQQGHQFEAFLGVLPTGIVWKPDDFDNAIHLFGQIKNCSQLSPKYNPRECVVSEIIKDHLIRQTLFAKGFEYVVNGGQWSIMTVNRFRKFVAETPADGKANDEAFKNNKMPEEVMLSHYYPIEWWQQFDVDDFNDFVRQEYLFHNFILASLGDNCYEEYGQHKKEQER
jgi:N-acylneuraminate cytidylyltransferase